MIEEKTVIGRLMGALKCASIAELARELDVAYNTAFAWSSRGKVPAEYILATAIKTGASPQWLEFGKQGAPTQDSAGPNARERAMLDGYRRLDEFSKRNVDQIVRALVHYIETASEPNATAEPSGKRAALDAAQRSIDSITTKFIADAPLSQQGKAKRRRGSGR